MKAGYIDSSFLLSIIVEDANYERSIDIWNTLDILMSSILLEIECRINVYKYCVLTVRNKELYRDKDETLRKLLQSIHKKMIDAEILLEIKSTDKLKQLKSLDSIHMATANIFKKLIQDKLLLCSYDTNMQKIAKELGMQVIGKDI